MSGGRPRPAGQGSVPGEDFIAELTQHIPDVRKHLTRYFGFYSTKTRGMRAKCNPGNDATIHIDQQTTQRPTPGARQARRRWAALIKRVYEVDPLTCSRCGATMSIISFIEPSQPHVIEKILTHCGLWKEPTSRAPPPTPPLPDVHYVSDLAYVEDFACEFPDWPAA